MTTYHWLTVLTCLGQLVLAALAGARSRRDMLALLLTLLALALFTWNAADLAADFSSLDAWNRIDRAASAMTMPLVVHFVLTLTGHARRLRALLAAVYTSFAVVMLADVLGVWWPLTAPFGGSPSWAITLLALVVPSLAICLLALSIHYRGTSSRLERDRTILVLAALVTGCAFGSADLWLVSGLTVPRLTNVGTLLSAVLLALVAFRLGLLEETVPLLHLAAGVTLGAVALTLYVAAFRSFTQPVAFVMAATFTLMVAVGLVVRHVAGRSVERRARLQHAATMGRFALQMAHDLKNPIAAMKASLEFLREERVRGRSLDPQADYLELMLEQVERMRGVVDRYQRLARLEPERAKVDIDALVEEVVLGFRNTTSLDASAVGGGRAVSVEHGAHSPTLNADPALVTGALQNLLTNSFAATAPGGKIAIRTACKDIAGRRWCVVSVEDDGAGMDARTQARAFEDFFTTRADGSGLGLSFVRRVAECHGGHAELTSREGAGTTVSIYLPTS